MRSLRVSSATIVMSLLLAALAATAIDLPVQNLLRASYQRGTMRDFYDAAEFFGNGFGVGMILIAAIAIDRFRRVQLGRLVTASLGAGLVANLGKLLIGRSRPYDADVEGLIASGGSAWDTFLGWAPMASLGAGGQSFPSAHTTTAFGLATALAYTYPKNARLFFTFAGGVAVQRVAASAHFPSDVLVGAALGFTWGHICCHLGLVARQFDRLEAWWSARFGWPLPDGHPLMPEALTTTPETPIKKAA